ncbi:MAG: apolipoprotein N-acyltransferase [Acidobacteria bacterium]|nr:apolipoprotein N-acyltransferase [Acidobacteriota bacterium]
MTEAGRPAADRAVSKRSRLTRTALLHAAALLSGALWGLCFASQTIVFLPWVALIPLLFLARQAHGLRLAFLHGLGAWLVAIAWIAHTVEVYGGLSPVLGWLTLLLLAAYLATYHLAFAALSRSLDRLSPWASLAFLPAAWVALEWVRSFLLSGFPWNLAAYSWVDVPGALRASSWIGAYGVSWLVVASNVALFLAADRRRLGLAAVGLSVPLAVLFVAAVWPASLREPGHLPVRLLQPNTPILTDSSSPGVGEAYRKLFRLSRRACDRPGSLLVWPESAAWPYALERDSTFRGHVEELAERGCAVLLNSPRWSGDEVFNSAFLVEGPNTQVYDKRHRVPFGEYVPLAELLPFVGSLARNAGDFTAGRTPGLLTWAAQKIGVSICFEVIFPAEVTELVAEGASILVTITNDAWYGDTFAPHQHLRAARFRAAENGRPLLRAALTGISAVVSADGAILDSLGVGEEGVIAAEISPRHHRTPYSRAPWLVPALSLALTLFAIFRSLRGHRS